jgi:hypothetical protein
VTQGDILGVDILIGMDIITTGDFAITNLDGWRTTGTVKVGTILKTAFVNRGSARLRPPVTLPLPPRHGAAAVYVAS